MVNIKLARIGTKHEPSYRFVALDKRKPTNGAVIETLGYYDPKPKEPKIEINEERVLYWLGQGAQPTDAAFNLLKRQGVWQKFIATKNSK